MSVIAGIYSRDPNRPLSDEMCERLSGAMSRHAGDMVSTFGDERTFFAKVEIGAWQEEGSVLRPDGQFAVAAGEPLLAQTAGGRTDDLASILEVVGDDGKLVRTLRAADGAFCFAVYDRTTQLLTIGTDKLGIRPLYYAVTDDHVIFASALRILEAMPEVPKKLNLRGVSEIATLGYALGDRTPYCGVSMMRPGGVLQVRDEQVSWLNHSRWSEIETSSASEAELTRQLYSDFIAAVRRRLRDDSVTSAYLSGGLDSRCVVDALRGEGADVHTFNFARPSTQDQLFGRQYAERVGAHHTEIPKRKGDDIPDYSRLMADAWLARSVGAERGQLVWSGEGGSVDLGHVHLSRAIVAQMRAGDDAAAIDEFIRREQVHLSTRILQAQPAKDLDGVIRRGIEEELARISHPDPARRFYLFLMLNEQHRKLAGHFENIDLHRLEFQLPFFDGSFVERIVSMPVDMCLEHRLYLKWLEFFGAAAKEVPWQSYPGHVPCPLPVPSTLSYQWDASYLSSERLSARRAMTREAATMIRADNFPKDILKRADLAVAALAYRTGLRDCGYIIETARTYYRYWSSSNGEFGFE